LNVRIPPETLVDGCVQTLQERVLPALASKYARGQLYAVVDVLRNLRDRIEEKSALLAAEAESAAAALARAAVALRAGGADAAAVGAQISAAIAAAPAGPLERRRDALNEVFVQALAGLDALAEPAAEAAHAALGGHLAAQAVRDLMVLKPSMLEEISRG
jgi:hypothetical protein